MPLKPTRMCHPLRSLPLWRPPCPRTWPHAIMHHQALLAPFPLAPSPPPTGLRRPRRMSRPRARGEGAGRGHVPRKRYSMAQRDDARNATTRKSKSGGCRGGRIAQNVNEKHWQISRFTPFRVHVLCGVGWRVYASSTRVHCLCRDDGSAGAADAGDGKRTKVCIG